MRAAVAAVIAFLITGTASAGELFAWEREDRNFAIFEGSIEEGDVAQFQQWFANLNPYKMSTVFLNSPGGDLGPAIRMGELMRLHDVRTVVAPRGRCVSACFFAFIGGAERSVPDNSQLGVHQFTGSAEYETVDSAQRTAQALVADLLQYVKEMDVEQEALLPALLTPPEDMYIFTRDDLVRMGIDRWAAPQETAEATFPTERYEARKQFWFEVTVRDFVDAHPYYRSDSELWSALDEEVKRLQIEAEDEFDPSILTSAHRNLLARGN